MIAPLRSSSSNAMVLQVGFLAILPRIEVHARFAFRHLRCPGRQEDAVAETIALAWRWYVVLARRGKDASAFASTLALRCAQAVRSGRRLCGHESHQDVLAPIARHTHDITVESLRRVRTFANPWEEALHDNSVSPVPDQVGWRLDFPRWRGSHSPRNQAILDDLMVGERTREVAQRHALSPARVSQLRQAFHASWLQFHGEDSSRRSSIA